MYCCINGSLGVMGAEKKSQFLTSETCWISSTPVEKSLTCIAVKYNDSSGNKKRCLANKNNVIMSQLLPENNCKIDYYPIQISMLKALLGLV